MEEKRNRNGKMLSTNVSIESLNIQFGDTHSNSYYGNAGDWGRSAADDDWGCWDTGKVLDMNKVAEAIHKDTGVPLLNVQDVLYAESCILDELGLTTMIDVDGYPEGECGCGTNTARANGDKKDGSSDSTDTADVPQTARNGNEPEDSDIDQEYGALERLIQAVFPELKGKKYTVVLSRPEQEESDGE